jgi:hypothetical protein
MYSTQPHPHLAWLDLWQYSSELPMVMAGPFFGPLLACGFDPTHWTSLMNTYALLPTAMAGGLAKPKDPTPSP